MKIERSKNTIKGSVWGLINQTITILFPFIIRTCIIYVLGVKYVGIGSLFTSILSVLSLAELGVGSVITFSMYKPIADDDCEKICALLNLYKKIYFYIGLVVLFIGMIIVPFLPYLINDTVPDGLNIYILYLFYLANSVFSYWVFAYKTCLLNAFQRYDVITRISICIRSIFFTLQLIVLWMTHNYYLYIFLMPLTSVVLNITTSKFVDKHYSTYIARGEVSRGEKKKIREQVVGLLSQRFAYTSRNALDNIIISAFIGLTSVTIYGNYFYVITALTGILSVPFSSMQAGIGNSIASETKEKNHADLLNINFLYLWLSAIFMSCYAVSIQTFMRMWVGKEYLFPTHIVLMLAFYFYNMKMTDPIGAYISATGIWWQCKWIYALEAITNLVLNFLLGYLWGITGVIIATMISVLGVNYFCTVKVLHDKYFTKKSIKYISENLYYMAVSTAIMLINYYTINIACSDFCVSFVGNYFIEFVLKNIACFIMSNILLLLVHSRSCRFRDCYRWLKSKLHF